MADEWAGSKEATVSCLGPQLVSWDVALDREPCFSLHLCQIPGFTLPSPGLHTWIPVVSRSRADGAGGGGGGELLCDPRWAWPGVASKTPRVPALLPHPSSPQSAPSSHL